MRRFQIYLSLSLLASAAGVVACDDTDGEGTDDVADADADADGDGDGDDATDDATTDADTTDTGNGCFTQPEECQRMIECLDVILPGQPLEDFAVDGSCWCDSTQENAMGCYTFCLDQLDAAVTQNPTVGECHGRYCPVEELNTEEPYGPGPCNANETDLSGLPLAGHYCAPDCGGVSQTCPEHTQTIAQGTCMWTGNPSNLCALRCYVDPYVFPSGTQCQCGATCKPYGGADGDGNARGVCTYD
jgi:hypothetical protein